MNKVELLNRKRLELASKQWNTVLKAVPAYTNKPTEPRQFVGHAFEVNSPRFKGKKVPRHLMVARVETEAVTLSELEISFNKISRYLQGEHPPKIAFHFAHRVVKTGYPTNINEQSPVEDIFEYMMSQGWAYSDTISFPHQNRTIYRHLSFSRNDWHGRVALDVNFARLADATEDCQPLYYELSQQALQAWNDFSDSVPHQNARGEIKEDHFKTKLFKEQG